MNKIQKQSGKKKNSLLKKIIISWMLSLMVFGSVQVVAAASITDTLGSVVDKLFVTDDGTGIVSLTDFKGGLSAPSAEGYDPKLTEVTSAREFVVKIIKFALSFLGLIAVIISIYGGVRILTSAGEADGVEKGRKAITYAVIGIIVIMSSYAIVNTVLQAPGGAPAGGQTQTAAQNAALGLTPVAGSNTQAGRIYNVVINIIKTYQNYAQGVLVIENIQQSVDKMWNGTGLNNQTVASNTISQIETSYGTIADALSTTAVRSTELSVLTDMVQYQRLFVKKWIDTRRAEVIAVGNAALRVTDKTAPATSVDITTFNGDFSAYGKYFTVKYGELVVGLKDGSYDIDGSKVSIGINAMKTQLASDFDAQIDKYSKEVADVKSSLSQADGTLTITDAGRALFEKLYASNIGSPDMILQLKKDKVSPLDSKKTLKDLATNLGGLYEILKDLKGVDVKLSTSIKEGNAPLIVTFKTQGSKDPSNLSIVDENIFWDLDGDGSFGKTGKEVNSVGCVEPKSAVATCIYKKPGTYHIAVKVKSSSLDNSVIEGIQYVDIKVNPARARFNLQLISTNNNHEEIIPITAYDKNGLLKIDRARVQLAFSEIQKSLKFSATGTISGDTSKLDDGTDLSKQSQDTIQRVKWSFGDGSEVDDSPAENPNILVVDHPYAKKGNYQVTLEVTGKDGIVDRKIFSVNVSDISAIINVTPGYTAKVNSPITFTSSVTSDGSKVIVTEWSSTPENGKLSSKQPQFSAAIDKPGTYTVELRVQNENKSEAIDKIDITIESNPPVAKFSAKPPVASRPAEILLDGSDSYDPDGVSTKILYQWKLEGEENKDYKILDGNETNKTMLIQYLTIGDRKVELTAEDESERGKTTKALQTVSIKSLLDMAWSDTTQSTGVLNASGEAEITLAIQSNNGKTYSWDFGDGEVEDGVFETPIATTKHIYKKAGVFTAFVTIKDDNNASAGGSTELSRGGVSLGGNSLKISKRISIGSGDAPIVSTRILVNGQEPDSTQMFTVNRKDVTTFDASASKNRDGTAQNLDYSWDFGDGKKSTKSSSTYSYKTLSPKDIGYFTAKVTITDKLDPTKKSEDTFKINVVALKPQLKTLLVIPLSAEFKTPTRVQLKAIEAKAPEGSIVSYRWWYYDPKDDTNELGSQITTTPETTLTIGTKGEEGEQVIYSFQVEMRDSENQIITAADILGAENLPTLTVTNGANKPPVAEVIVNKTSVGVGEAITFTSNSKDVDGKIVSYIWDLDGNGFQNDETTTKSSVTKTYDTVAPGGIKVRLKVIDDSYAEGISPPLTIYITSKTIPPKAAFTAMQKDGTMQVIFNSTTTVDPLVTVTDTVWDFDTASTYNSADSDGNGIKDDDKDATTKNPSYTYQASGIYYVQLSVKDSAGITNVIKLPVTVKPVVQTSASGAPIFVIPTSSTVKAILKTVPEKDLMDNRIHLSGESGNITIDYSASQGAIVKYVIDKNIYFDSNGDGVSDNDENYQALTPGKWPTDYQKSWGKTGIKLTVFDKDGKSSSETADIIFDTPLASGANNVFAVPGAVELAGSLASMFGFGILSYRSRRNKEKV